MPLPIETEKSRHPYEVFILSICLILGVSIILGGKPPASISAQKDLGFAEDIWGYLLAGGAGLGLVGGYCNSRSTGLILTQIGLIALGGSAVMYAVAILIATNFRMTGYLPTLIIGWFGFNSLRRFFQIQKEIDAASRKARLDGGH